MVGYATAIFAHSSRQFGLSQPKLVHQGTVGLGPFDWIQIFSLNVFDEGHLGLSEAVHIARDDRDFRQSCELGGTPATLAGDQFKPIATAADDQWLNNSR